MQTVQQLIKLADSDRFEATYEVALANLVCAQGLPGSEDLVIEAVLDWIDDAARRVHLATELNYPKFIERPGQFANSQAIFCMATLMTVLQTELGVRYNPARIDEPYEFRNSQDRFIHGITHGEGGTCMTLPVLVAAVGRRLEYPIRLVKGTIHVFCRWEGQSPFLVSDGFNIEATARGLVCGPDEHYLNWPYPPTDPAWDEKTYLKSLSPREELAMFLAGRGFVLMEHGKYVQALEAYTCARSLAPDNMRYRAYQDLMLLLALDVPIEKPSEADAVLIGNDGRQHRPFHWPQPVANAERLPAAALPPEMIDELIPPFTPDMAPGEVADALLPGLPQLMDVRWVEKIQLQVAQARISADALRHNTMVRQRREAMAAEMQRLTAENKARQERMFAEMQRLTAENRAKQEWMFAAMVAPSTLNAEHFGTARIVEPQAMQPLAEPPNNRAIHGYPSPLDRTQQFVFSTMPVRRQIPLALLARAT